MRSDCHFLRWGLILCELLILIPEAQAAGNTYYVATTGDDSRSCDAAKSVSTPRKTLAKGVECMARGDRLEIRGGTYTAGSSFGNGPSRVIPSGTSWENPTVITNYNSETVVLQPVIERPDAYDICGFRFNSYLVNGIEDQYIILQNFTIDGINCGGHSAIGFASNYTGKYPHHIRVDNVEVKHFYGTVAAIGGGKGTSHIEIINSRIHDNGTTDFDHGFYVLGDNYLIEGNDIYRNAGWGIHKYNVGDNNIIRNNRVYDNARAGNRGTGIGLYGGVGNQVYNNLIWSNREGIAVNYGESNAIIYNNSVYKNSGACISLYSGSSHQVKNNICWQNGSTIK